MINSSRSSSLAIGSLGLFTSLNLVYAQGVAPDSTTSPYAEVQSSTLSGSTDVINLSMMPVVLSNGTIAYENLTVPLEVSESSAGAVTVTAGPVTLVKAPVGMANGFEAGTYYVPGSSAKVPHQVIALSGPGVTTGGATEWSVAVTAAATGCTYPPTATFYVGPLTSNPLYSRLKAAGITSTAFSYGIMGSNGCGDGWWYPGIP